MLDAYAEATSMTARVVDPRLIAQARSKLTKQRSQLTVDDPDCSMNSTPLTIQTSPNTIIQPPSVTHHSASVSSTEYLDVLLKGSSKPPISSSTQSDSLGISSSSQKQVSPYSRTDSYTFVREENVDEVNLDEPYPYSDIDHTPQSGSYTKRKLDEVNHHADLKLISKRTSLERSSQLQSSSIAMLGSSVEESPPPPPPDSPA